MESTSLREKIEASKRKEAEIRDQALEQRRETNRLMELRKECDHDFAPPLKNFEHEGGHCKHCGINEIYWLHIKSSQ